MQGMARGGTDGSLKRLHRAVGMEEAILLEEAFSDAALGLEVSSANPHGYPINI